ncbi:unnamed protein product [Polarella glacialis]|uniref:Uncharacterized protein n=1 Tax=Polarella glacialis TaxID=89957 RepID=A0A813JT37_POLGL|nr:unnamed protein product [Polarella glacialis]
MDPNKGADFRPQQPRPDNARQCMDFCRSSEKARDSSHGPICPAPMLGPRTGGQRHLEAEEVEAFAAQEEVREAVEARRADHRLDGVAEANEAEEEAVVPKVFKDPGQPAEKEVNFNRFSAQRGGACHQRRLLAGRGAMALPGMDVHMPPSAAGEWPGAVSAKFTDKFTARPLLRKMVDTDCRNGSASGLANNGFGRYFADRGGLIPTEGKRIAHVPASEVVAWRPSVRPLAEPGSLHLEKPEGRLQVEHAPGKVFSMPEKRHLRQVESKEEYSDRAVGMRVVYRENGLRAYDQPAREIDVQTEMQRKAKNSDLLSQRNGIGCRSLGDKNYRHPDYCGRFHQAGGLIVGSGFHRGMHSKTEPRNSTSVQLVMADGDRKPSKTYKEKLLEQEAQEAQAEVEELTRNWETGTLKAFFGGGQDLRGHVYPRQLEAEAVSERGFGMEVLKRRGC